MTFYWLIVKSGKMLKKKRKKFHETGKTNPEIK